MWHWIKTFRLSSSDTRIVGRFEPQFEGADSISRDPSHPCCQCQRKEMSHCWSFNLKLSPGAARSRSTSEKSLSPTAWTIPVLRRSLPSTASTTSSPAASSSSTLRPSSSRTSATTGPRRTPTSGSAREQHPDLKVSFQTLRLLLIKFRASWHHFKPKFGIIGGDEHAKLVHVFLTRTLSPHTHSHPHSHTHKHTLAHNNPINPFLVPNSQFSSKLLSTTVSVSFSNWIPLHPDFRGKQWRVSSTIIHSFTHWQIISHCVCLCLTRSFSRYLTQSQLSTHPLLLETACSFEWLSSYGLVVNITYTLSLSRTHTHAHEHTHTHTLALFLFLSLSLSLSQTHTHTHIHTYTHIQIFPLRLCSIMFILLKLLWLRIGSGLVVSSFGSMTNVFNHSRYGSLKPINSCPFKRWALNRCILKKSFLLESLWIASMLTFFRRRRNNNYQYFWSESSRCYNVNTL